MSLLPLNLSLPFARRTSAIATSGLLLIFSFVFMIVCFSQLTARPPFTDKVQAAFAIASIVQVLLVALTSTTIYASWKESSRLIRLSAYSIIAHLALNLIVLVWLLTAVSSIKPCPPGGLRCPKLVVAKPALVALSAIILIIQLSVSLIVPGYYFHLRAHSRWAYAPEVSSRSLAAPAAGKPDQRGLLSNSEIWPNVELGTVESATATSSFKMPEAEVGYGGGMRTYEEAEENEKARLRQEVEEEDEEGQVVSFPVPSTSESGILTPLGLQWRDGDLPQYAS